MKYFSNLLSGEFSKRKVPEQLKLSNTLYTIIKDSINITDSTTLRELASLMKVDQELILFDDLMIFINELAYTLKKSLGLMDSRDDLEKYIEELIIENIDFLGYGYYLTNISYAGSDITTLKELFETGLLSKIDYNLFPILSDYNIFETNVGIRRELTKSESTRLEELFGDQVELGYTQDKKAWYSISLGTSTKVSSMYSKDLNLLEVTKFILKTFNLEQATYLLEISSLYNNRRSRKFTFKSIDGVLAIPLFGELYK